VYASVPDCSTLPPVQAQCDGHPQYISELEEHIPPHDLTFELPKFNHLIHCGQGYD